MTALFTPRTSRTWPSSLDLVVHAPTPTELDPNGIIIDYRRLVLWKILVAGCVVGGFFLAALILCLRTVLRENRKRRRALEYPAPAYVNAATPHADHTTHQFRLHPFWHHTHPHLHQEPIPLEDMSRNQHVTMDGEDTGMMHPAYQRASWKKKKGPKARSSRLFSGANVSSSAMGPPPPAHVK
ncbi:hypothetical protein H0H81_008784, partial [Sphagnurus paluster]